MLIINMPQCGILAPLNRITKTTRKNAFIDQFIARYVIYWVIFPSKLCKSIIYQLVMVLSAKEWSFVHCFLAKISKANTNIPRANLFHLSDSRYIDRCHVSEWSFFFSQVRAKVLLILPSLYTVALSLS